MSTFPGALDSFTNPIGSDTFAGVPHHSQHANANDAIEAIEARLKSTPTIVDLRDWDDYDATGVDDSTTAIQAAIAQAATFDGIEVRGSGLAAITSTLTISSSGLTLAFPVRGVGTSSTQQGDEDIGYYDSHVFALSGEPRTPGLLWGGTADGGPMLDFAPADGRGITYSGFRGSLYAGVSPFTTAAGIGLRLGGASFGTFDVHALEFTDAAVLLWSGAMHDSRYFHRSNRGNIFNHLTARQYVNSGDVLRFEGNGLHSTLTISAISQASPTVVTTTTAHGLQDGLQVTISGSNSDPVVDSTYYVKYVSATRFSLFTDSGLTTPKSVDTAGTTGTAITTFLFKVDSYRNRFEVVDFGHKDGDGIVLGWCDHNWFGPTRGTRYSGGTGAAVRFEAAAESNTQPADIVFQFLAPGAGGVVVEGTDSDTYAVTRTQNNQVIYDPDIDAPSEPTLGTGADLYWWNPNSVTLPGRGDTLPPHPVNGDRFILNTLAQMLYYDGTQWQSQEVYSVDVPNINAGAKSANAIVCRGSVPFSESRNILISRFGISYFVASGASALSGSHYWTVNLVKRSLSDTSISDSGSALGAVVINSGSSGVIRDGSQTGMAVLPGYNTAACIEVQVFKTGTPGDLTLLGANYQCRVYTT